MGWRSYAAPWENALRLLELASAAKQGYRSYASRKRSRTSRRRYPKSRYRSRKRWGNSWKTPRPRLKKKNKRVFKLGYLGMPQTARKGKRYRQRKERFTLNMDIGSVTVQVICPQWLLTSKLYDFCPGNVLTGYTSPNWTFTAACPTEGLDYGGISGESYYEIKQEMRLCMQAGAGDVCVRVVMLQIFEDTTNVAVNAFTLNDFYESDNITSYRKQTDVQEYKYKVLIDKSFHLGPGGDLSEKEKDLTLQIRRGTLNYKTRLNVSSAIFQQSGRVVWGIYADNSTEANRIFFYGNYQHVYQDDN